MNTALANLKTCLLFGASLVAIGIVVVVLAWPAADVGARESGSHVAAILGLAVTAVGQALLMVAVIGYGVMLGTQAANPPARTRKTAS